MEADDVQRWFDGYLEVFGACGRGEREDVELLLEYYDVPLLLTTPGAVHALAGEAEVLAAARQQIDGMRSMGYHRSEVLGADVEILNDRTALYRGSFSRRRQDDSEIASLRVTYLITDGPAGRRISALVVHAG